MLNQQQEEPAAKNLNWPSNEQDQQDRTLLQPECAAQPISNAELKQLKAQLNSHSRDVRAQAEASLLQLGVGRLTALMAYERLHRKRFRIIVFTCYAALIAAAMAYSVVARSHHFSVFFNFIGPMIGILAATTKFHRTGVMALAKLEQPEAVGELLPGLEITDKEVQQVVRQALIQVLPKLRSSDANLITETNRRTMRRFLQGKLSGGRAKYRDGKANKQLTIAMLTSLQQVGDASFVDVVEHLAEPSGIRVFPNDPDIVAAAKECLPYLQERVQSLAARSELVRASAANSVGGSDTLVRPVIGTPEIHPEELVRAAGDGREGS